MDQKTVFTERLRRIDKGKQIEPEGVIGRKFQKKYEHKFGVKAQRERQSTRNAFVLLIAIALGALAMLCGRLGYFHLSKLEGLPEAFYDLQGRGVARSRSHWRFRPGRRFVAPERGRRRGWWYHGSANGRQRRGRA